MTTDDLAVDPRPDSDGEVAGCAGGADGQGRLVVWLGVVTAVVGVLVSVAVLPPGKLLVFGLLVLAVLPWAAVLTRRTWQALTYMLASALTVVFCALALAAIYYPDRPGTARPRQDRVPRLKFLEVPGRVPHCASLSGEGSIPHGYQLALFDRATDSAGHYTPTSTFSFDGAAAASPAGRGWTAPQLYLGSGDSSDEGDHIAITAVLMPEKTAAFLAALTSTTDHGMLPAEAVELGTKTDEIVVVRNAENRRCPT